jgi:hypothetical protein
MKCEMKNRDLYVYSCVVVSEANEATGIVHVHIYSGCCGECFV